MTEPEFRTPAGPPPLRTRARDVLVDFMSKVAGYSLFKLVEKLLLE